MKWQGMKRVSVIGMFERLRVLQSHSSIHHCQTSLLVILVFDVSHFHVES